jgi:rsbT co-antagonist protein RsbR
MSIHPTTPEAEESESLRARVDALEAENAALRAERDQAVRITDLVPSLIYLYDLSEQRNVYANRQLAESLGYSAEEILRMGAGVLPAIMHPEDLATMPEHIGRLLQAPDGVCLEVAYRCRRPDGAWRWYLSRDMTFSRDEGGSPRVILGLVDDITERRRAEEGLRIQAEEIARQAEELERREDERLALQQQVIEAHRDALRELSTPLLPIADRVLAMPLIGAIDPARSQRILEVLLQGIVEQQAQVAILDITGVREVDAQVADALVRVVKAAGLLGAGVVLTGISPAVARALVGSGADLGTTVTLGTLQSGIAYALARAPLRRAGGREACRP